jgi:hypothetical protein
LAAAEGQNIGASPRADPIKPGVRKESGKQWAGEVGMVRNVIEIRSELEFEPFSDRGHFADGEIQVLVIWT